MKNKFFRSNKDVILSGLCGGIGDYIGVDSTIIRLAFIGLSFFGGFAIILYLLGWIIVPKETI